jgi:hypothetical protein
MNTYTMEIKDMIVISEISGYTNFVTRIAWNYKGVNEIGVESEFNAVTKYTQVDEENFIEYSAITESNVIAWIESHPDLLRVKSYVDNSIANKMSKSKKRLPFPWLT